jgi:hypothetical protein
VYEDEPVGGCPELMIVDYPHRRHIRCRLSWKWRPPRRRCEGRDSVRVCSLLKVCADLDECTADREQSRRAGRQERRARRQEGGERRSVPFLDAAPSDRSHPGAERSGRRCYYLRILTTSWCC